MKIFKIFVMTAVVGLGVIPAAAHSQTDDHMNLKTGTGWNLNGQARTVTKYASYTPTSKPHWSFPSVTGTWYANLSYGGYSDFVIDNSNNLWYQVSTFSWAGPRPLSSKNNIPGWYLGGSDFFSRTDGTSPFIPQTSTVTQRIFLSGELQNDLTEVSTVNNNTVFNVTVPNSSGATFNFWKLNGVNQSTELPTSITINSNTTIDFYFTQNPQLFYNLESPNGNSQNSAVSIWSSYQGNIALGEIIPSGTSYSGNIFVQAGETIRITVDGQTVYEYQFPLENPADQTFSYTIPNIVPEPTPVPTPTPLSAEPTPTPAPFPTPNPTPEPGTYGPISPPPGGVTTITNVTPSSQTNSLGSGSVTQSNIIVNPFLGNTNTNLNQEDLYDTIKKAIKDGQKEDAPNLAQIDDPSTTDLNDKAETATEELDSLGQALYDLGEEIDELKSAVGELIETLRPRFPQLGTNNSLRIALPVIGSFDLNIQQQPGWSMFRTLSNLLIWLLTMIFTIHIVRRAIA